jgi:hypothetical protein
VDIVNGMGALVVIEEDGATNSVIVTSSSSKGTAGVVIELIAASFSIVKFCIVQRPLYYLPY